jgi:hypothetical protein
MNIASWPFDGITPFHDRRHAVLSAAVHLPSAIRPSTPERLDAATALFVERYSLLPADLALIAVNGPSRDVFQDGRSATPKCQALVKRPFRRSRCRRWEAELSSLRRAADARGGD